MNKQMLTALAAAISLGVATTAVANDDKAKAGKTQGTGAEVTMQFSEIDKDNDGYIARTDLASTNALGARFDTVDADKDGRISRNEYQNWSTTNQAKATATVSTADTDTRSFTEIDEDGDGYVARTELTDDAELQASFAELDEDADGRVSRTEYDTWTASVDADTDAQVVQQEDDGLEAELEGDVDVD